MKGIRKVLSGVYIENNYVNCRGKLIHFLIIVTDTGHSKLHNLASLLKIISDDRGIGVVFASFFLKKLIFA